MPQNDSQVPWTDEQWARVNNAIQEEASRARVAATFLPMVGPLPADTDFVRREQFVNQNPIRIEDRITIRLATLQVKVSLRGAQMADPDLTSALALFRRAANVLARLEDTVVFDGLAALPALPGDLIPRVVPAGGAGQLPAGWEIAGGEQNPGLWQAGRNYPIPVDIAGANDGRNLVRGVSDAIGRLEARGQFGPYAAVLDQGLFNIAQTPDPLVLPQDQIIPFLGGGSLLRCSALPGFTGVVVALGGAPVELVVATDMSLRFLQLTTAPMFVFRVFEKLVLRIKEPAAIRAIIPGDP